MGIIFDHNINYIEQYIDANVLLPLMKNNMEL